MVRPVRLQQADRVVEVEPFTDAQCQLAFALQVFVDEEDVPTRIVLGRGDAPARGIGQGEFGGPATARGSGRRNLRLDQSSRRLTQNAGGLAVGIVIDFTAYGSLSLRRDSADFQGRGVGVGDVPVHAAERRRMAASHCVKVLTGRQLTARPQRVVPSTTHQPIAGSGGFGAGGDALLHLLQRTRAAQVNTLCLEASLFQVYVGVVEAGHHEVTAEIDHLGMRAFELADIIVRADSNDAVSAHAYRLRTPWCRLGVDVAIHEDRVGWRKKLIEYVLHVGATRRCSLWLSPNVNAQDVE